MEAWRLSNLVNYVFFFLNLYVSARWPQLSQDAPTSSTKSTFLPSSVDEFLCPGLQTCSRNLWNLSLVSASNVAMDGKWKRWDCTSIGTPGGLLISVETLPACWVDLESELSVQHKRHGEPWLDASCGRWICTEELLRSFVVEEITIADRSDGVVSH